MASAQASMTQVIGLFGPMCSSLNGFNYHKRVTFFDLDRHCFFPEIQIISGTHARDQEGLAGIGFGSGIHDPGNWAIWIYVLITE